MKDVLDDPKFKQIFDFAPFGQPPLQSSMTWHQLIPLTSGRYSSVNKRAGHLVVTLSSARFSCWLCRVWNRWNSYFLRNTNNKKETLESQITPVFFRGIVCKAYDDLSDISVLREWPYLFELFLPKNRVQKLWSLFRSDHQPNHHPSNKELENLWCVCMPI